MKKKIENTTLFLKKPVITNVQFPSQSLTNNKLSLML